MTNAMYCLNGHYIGILHPTRRAVTMREFQAMLDEESAKQPPAFCTRCGALSINACQHCQTLIEPQNYQVGRPGYCGGCGRAFPWTEIALTAAKEYTDELDLSQDEKATLKGTFAD